MTAIIASLLPAGLAFIMFALGLKLSVADFERVAARPGAIALGLVAQVLLLPLTAFALAVAFRLSPEAAVGLMILAACPGGVSAAMITNLARGDTCLSITLTAFTSLLAFLTVPAVVGLSLQYFLGADGAVTFPVAQGIGGLFLITLVPVAAGLMLKRTSWYSEGFARAMERLATIVFFVIVVSTFVNEWPNITEHFSSIGPAILLLNAVTMTTGALLGIAARLPADGRIALAVECGIQNSALGITVAVSVLQVAEFAVPSVIYAFLMNVTALALIAVRQLQPGRAAGQYGGA